MFLCHLNYLHCFKIIKLNGSRINSSLANGILHFKCLEVKRMKLRELNYTSAGFTVIFLFAKMSQKSD